ncbi:NADH-quinone oxidoreductase subunit F [Rhodococcus sp. 1168]|uniref:NADH-quinone oxidoreductase subunit F n=1 Tax=Rhodococcus sp. 1168 TaxID=2018041 RepID=UPI0020CB54AD|nr:NADH-quinone oxidoreductase subunit F [Rhodococcus sp. 1168]
MIAASSTIPLLSGARFDLERHAQLFGPLPHADHSVIASVGSAGLTGRGGAAFPAGRKMDSLRGRRAVVIANGSEGEPLSSKDAVLLSDSPHLVLDGLSIAGAAIEATDSYLVVPEGRAEQLRRAVLERRKSGWDTTAAHIVVSTAGFVSGEKSAVIAAAEGRRPVPKYSPTSSSVSGLKGRPTLVHNVETLAHIATIARFGVDWFRSSGLAGEPGTMLVTLSGAVNRPGVVEVSMGIPIGTLLADIGRTDLRRVRAVLIGGYHGNWLNSNEFAGRSLSRASLAPLGAGPGAGVVHALSVET